MAEAGVLGDEAIRYAASRKRVGEGKSGMTEQEMTEQEIRDAHLAIDLPFESGTAQPRRLRYAEGVGEAYAGPPPEWTPDGTPATPREWGDAEVWPAPEAAPGSDAATGDDEPSEKPQ